MFLPVSPWGKMGVGEIAGINGRYWWYCLPSSAYFHQASFTVSTMIFYRLNKSYLQEACSGLAPNMLLFPDTSDGNLLSETASSTTLVQYLYQGENRKKTTKVMKQKGGRGAEKGSKSWKPTHSSVHVSRGRYRENRRNTCSLSQKSCGCMVKVRG